MTIRTKIDPVAHDVEVIVNSDLSPAAQSRAIAAFARGRLSEAQAANRQALGRVPPHMTTVDGRQEAALDSVRPQGGVIVFEFELVADVLRWIAATLVARSPRRSGEYIRGHTLFADGQQITLGPQIPFALEYSFTNTVAYARKIEIGQTQSGRAFVIQVPNRIYERTARDARSRFGNIAKIDFTYRGIVGAGGGDRFPTILVRPN